MSDQTGFVTIHELIVLEERRGNVLNLPHTELRCVILNDAGVKVWRTAVEQSAQKDFIAIIRRPAIMDKRWFVIWNSLVIGE